MPIQQIFVHGNSVWAETPLDQLAKVDGVHWSDLLGRAANDGRTFRGFPGARPNSAFHVSIPTPAWRSPGAVLDQGGTHAKLLRVGFKLSADPDVIVNQLTVSRGADVVGTISGLSVGGIATGWQQNINYFLVPGQPDTYDGINIRFQVRFGREANITFHSIGADFLVSA